MMIIYQLYCKLGLQENEDLKLNIASLKENLNNTRKCNSLLAVENNKTIAYRKKEGGEIFQRII